MAVAAGQSHTVLVGEDGSVFSFGKNVCGQLGTGDNVTTANPTRVAGLPGAVRQVAAGLYHSGLVTEAGDLLMFGDGGSGQLGLGDEDNRTTPTLVARVLFDGEAVLMVACGYYKTVVATENGGVYTFGAQKEGDENNQLVPMRVPAAAFRRIGSAEGPGERIVMVATGDWHTVALSEAGHVFTWGLGMHGRLGHNDSENQEAPRHVDNEWFRGKRVVFVAAGEDHTVAVTAGGRLYTWGRGYFGRLGHGDTDHRLVPTLVQGFGVTAEGQVVTAACGGQHTLVVTQEGALWACGCGCDGRLGLNDVADRHVFERVGRAAFGGARVVAAAAGSRHSTALTENGALWTWGRGNEGRLGHGDLENRLVPTRVAAASLNHRKIGRCRLLPEDHVLAFTMGTHDRLGEASPVETMAGKPELVSMIARAGNRWVGGKAGESEGLIRLLGGVSADRRERYVQSIYCESTVPNRQPRHCRKCQLPH